MSMMQEHYEQQQQESSDKSDKKKELNKALVYREDAILGKDTFTAPIKVEDAGFSEVQTPPSTTSSEAGSSGKGRKRGINNDSESEVIIIDIKEPIKKLVKAETDTMASNRAFMMSMTETMQESVRLMRQLHQELIKNKN